MLFYDSGLVYPEDYNSYIKIVGDTLDKYSSFLVNFMRYKVLCILLAVSQLSVEAQHFKNIFSVNVHVKCKFIKQHEYYQGDPQILVEN